ncbi:IS66 family insertion sequence element accessory protein TnpB [bacterium]|nr:IS66 family insertion sequence element accessory protein TnpB [bacterium]
MIFDPKYPIYIFNDYVDMRKGHNTLAYIVIHKINIELLSGALFLFVAKSRKACKALFFDGNGLVLIHKKLERGRFMSFENIVKVTEINSNELKLILNGGQIPLSKTGKKISLKR